MGERKQRATRGEVKTGSVIKYHQKFPRLLYYPSILILLLHLGSRHLATAQHPPSLFALTRFATCPSSHFCHFIITDNSSGRHTTYTHGRAQTVAHSHTHPFLLVMSDDEMQPTSPHSNSKLYFLSPSVPRSPPSLDPLPTRIPLVTIHTNCSVLQDYEDSSAQSSLLQLRTLARQH